MLLIIMKRSVLLSHYSGNAKIPTTLVNWLKKRKKGGGGDFTHPKNHVGFSIKGPYWFWLHALLGSKTLGLNVLELHFVMLANHDQNV